MANRETEFGGMDGLLQPVEKGAVRTPSELLGMSHRSDPEDATSGTGTGGSAA